MHGVARDRRLPEHQLIDKGHHHEAAAEAEHSTVVMPVVKACQRNNNDLIQESIPDLKMSEQLIPVAYCFPFA